MIGMRWKPSSASFTDKWPDGGALETCFISVIYFSYDVLRPATRLLASVSSERGLVFDGEFFREGFFLFWASSLRALGLIRHCRLMTAWEVSTHEFPIVVFTRAGRLTCLVPESTGVSGWLLMV